MESRVRRPLLAVTIVATLVLVAVFVPITFMQGNTGRLFSEFSIALAGAVCF